MVPLPDIDQLSVIEGQGSLTVSTTPTAKDNCAGTVTGTTTDPLEYSSLGEYTITWIYDDGNGNVSTQQQTIRVIDTIPPVPDIISLTTITGECSATLATTPTATDAVIGQVTGITSDPLEYTEQETYTIVWTYDDGNGNISSQTQTVIVDDVTAPVPDVDPLPIIEGEGSVTVSASPTATDNCLGTITATTTDPLEYSSPGDYIINWTCDDGNENTTTQQQTIVVTPSIASLIIGNIYDDKTGLPISGASLYVRAIDDNTPNPPLNYSSDDNGKISISVVANKIAFEVTKDGYTTVTREADIIPGSSNELLNIRLTLLGDKHTLSPSQISVPIDDDSNLSAADSISEAIEIQSTIISQQGINSPLPLGWSPLYVVELDVVQPISLPLLKLTTKNKHNISLADEPVMVFWDNDTYKWISAITPELSPDGSVIEYAINKTGQFALVIPDAGPLRPPIPNEGDILQGVSFDFNPSDSIASVEFKPISIVSGGEYKSFAQLIITSNYPIPSGFHFKTNFSEQYSMSNGTELIEPSYYQDIALYEYPSDNDRTTQTSLFPVTPRHQFPIGKLKSGQIKLSILDSLVESVNTSNKVIGVDGGEIVLTSGIKIQVESNSVSADTSFNATDLVEGEIPSVSDSNLTYVGGINLQLSEENITNSRGLKVSLPGFTGYPDGTAAIIAHHIKSASSSFLTVAATGKIINGNVENDPCHTDKCFPGIMGSGQYAVYVPKISFGFVTGSTLDTNNAQLPNVSLKVEELPFSYSSDDAGKYIVVAPMGNFTISAENHTENLSDQYTDTVNNQDEIKNVDLVLLEIVFEAVDVKPLDKEVRVPLDVQISVRLSRQADKGTVSPDSVQLKYLSNNQTEIVKASILVSGDEKEIKLIPKAEIPENTVFELLLTEGVKDLSGNPLNAFTSTFTTADIFENNLVSPGSLLGVLPDENDISTITGGIGVAAPNSLVMIINNTTNTTTSVTADSNGSFEASINADITDNIVVRVYDLLGNSSDIEVRSFSGPDGKFLVRPDETNISNYEGIKTIIEPGSVDIPIVVTITKLQNGDVLPEIFNNDSLEYLGGVNIDLSGYQLKKELSLSIPAPGSVTSEDQILVLKVMNLNGTTLTTLVEIAHLTIDGRLQTSSPPFPGITQGGTYYFPKVKEPIGFVVVPVVIKLPEGYDVETQIPGVGFHVTPETESITVPIISNTSFALSLLNIDTKEIINSITVEGPAEGEIIDSDEILTDDVSFR